MPPSPVTWLRRAYERAREMDLEAQIRECVDLIENPDVVGTEMLGAVRAIAEHCDPHDPTATPVEADSPDELVLQHFSPRSEIVLDGAGSTGFTCLASDFVPLSDAGADTDDGAGLDYVGILSGQPTPGKAIMPGRVSGPVLGVVQSSLDASPYAMLLKLLACLTEIAPEEQLRRLDHELWKGALGDQPSFDLHLVLWEEPEENEAIALHHLTRDFAELAKDAAAKTEGFPAVIADIVCLDMSPDEFDGRLQVRWIV